MSGGALRAQFFTFGGALRAQFVKLGGALRAQFVNLAARYARTCAHCDEGATVLLNDGHAKAGQRSVDRLAHRGAAHGAHRHVRSADRAHTQVATRQQHDGGRGSNPESHAFFFHTSLNCVVKMLLQPPEMKFNKEKKR